MKKKKKKSKNFMTTLLLWVLEESPTYLEFL